MAHNESDREDLLREATALIERAELKTPDHADPIVIGFRRDGSASFYFGADPVYQCNSAGELRRAYIDGLLYKAERGQLVTLTRERSETETALIRHELTNDQTTALLITLGANLAQLRSAIEGGTYELIGEVPPERNVIAHIKDWLTTFSSPPGIANRPNVR